MNDGPKENTDRELWRRSEDAFAPSIHVTKEGAIGINVGGYVVVKSAEQWHALGVKENGLTFEQVRSVYSQDKVK